MDERILTVNDSDSTLLERMRAGLNAKYGADNCSWRIRDVERLRGEVGETLVARTSVYFRRRCRENRFMSVFKTDVVDGDIDAARDRASR